MPRLRPIALLLLLGTSLPAADAPAAAPPAEPGTIDPRRRTPVVEVFEQARDSVVNIASTQVVRVRTPVGLESFFDDRFDLFFNEPRTRGRARGQRQVTRTSVGSGFVLHPSGYIVTNAHVVARTAERKAIFADGSEHEADVVAIDESRDLAILKIEPPAGSKPLRPIPLGTSSDLMVGETVIAIGNPLGYQHTVTSGVVSATNRSLPVDHDHALDGLVQTDASINPGNSGGPLLNILGQLVGVNTAIRADAQNIGFAIPVDQLRDLLPAMLDVERRQRIVTGLVVAEAPTPDGARVRIERVEPDSPAEDAGLDNLPLILDAIDGTPVRSVFDYLIALIHRTPGETLQLTLRTADGRTHQRPLTLGERPRPDGARLLVDRLGLEATEIAEETRQRLPIRGLIVTGIRLNGAAQQAGLEVGDVLLQIGRHQPTTLDEVGELLEPLRAGEEITVAILRVQGRSLYRATTTLRVR